MKINRLTGLVLAAVAAVSLQQAAAQPLNLAAYTTNTTGVYTNTFDSLGYSIYETSDGTPSGTPGYLAGEWTCYINATANGFGTIAAGAPNNISGGIMNVWTNIFTGAFCNYASYYDYITTNNFYTNGVLTDTSYGVITNGLAQTNEPNRCLGIRQIGAFGDPGASFVLKLANTFLYDNFRLWVDWMNLDPTSPRTTTWQLQYGIADPVVGVPAAFQNLSPLFGTFINTPGSNHWKTVSISIPNGAINNINGQVWLRIVTLATSAGSGNRETFAIDNFGLTWQVGSAGCTPATSAITLTPPPAPVYANATVSWSVNEIASQPLYYQWLYNGVAIDQTAFSGQVVGNSYRSSILTLQNVTAANDGTYSCIVSNVCGGTVYSQTSPSAVLVVTNISGVTLGYLRSLTDSNNAYAPTVSVSQLWQVTGMITTLTNTTTGNTASYYLQDATGGMNLFVTGGSAFRPNIGDEVTAVGYLNGFDGNLEIEADLTGQNNATYVNFLSNNIANYPVAKLLDWPTEFAIGVTNSLVEQGLNGMNSKKGSICMLTNVYFGTNAGHVITGNYYAYVTNAAGLGGYVYFWGGLDTNLTGYVLPAFAYAVQGPLFANVVSGGGSFWSGIGVSQWQDIMTNPIVLSGARDGTSSTISWTAIPQTYSYNVLASPNVAGPYTPIATGLKFSTPAASYTDVNSANSQFYRVTTP